MTAFEWALIVCVLAMGGVVWSVCRAAIAGMTRVFAMSREREKASHDMIVKCQDRMMSACNISLRAREIEAEVERASFEGSGRPVETPPPSRVVEGFDGTLVPGEMEAVRRNGFAPID